MSDWIESYRGVVSAWECDIVEHFTIAYYFEKFADATRNYLELIGEGERLMKAQGAGPARLFTLFQHELRAGAAFHIETNIAAVDATSVTLGHRLVDTANDRIATWLAETLTLPSGMAAALAPALDARKVAWHGPEIPPPAPLPTSPGLLTARDRVKPWEVDETGHLSLSDHVHRFSGAGMHFLTSIGMTGEYMHANRRGFSTFMLDISLEAGATLGQRVDVHTALTHLGNTSLRYTHVMTGPDGRRLAAMMQAGVQLDLDARRPTAMPPHIRDAITRLAAAR